MNTFVNKKDLLVPPKSTYGGNQLVNNQECGELQEEEHNKLSGEIQGMIHNFDA